MLELKAANGKMYDPETRQLTVKCKTHLGTLYKFSEELFLTQIKPYCESIINSKQSKILKFVESHYEKTKKIREEVNPFLSHTLKRGVSFSEIEPKSSDFPMMFRKKLSLPQNDCRLTSTMSQKVERKSQKMENEGHARNRYLSLTRDGPIKSFPMVSQRAKFGESEFKDLSRLERNKEMLSKLK